MGFSVTLFTPDKQLANSLWEIKEDGIFLEQPLLKAMPSPEFIHEISAYAKDATVLIAFLGALLNLVKSKKNKNPGSETISIHCAENSTNVIQFIEANKGQINVVINQASDNSNDNCNR